MLPQRELIIEKFKQGITIHTRDVDGVTEPVKDLAVNGTEPNFIGTPIWEDVFEMFDRTDYQKVRVVFSYDFID